MPELTGVDLSTATAATRVASGMSGLFGAGYEVTRCSDSSYTTMCATNQGGVGNNWVAMQVPAGTNVGYVAVYNRRDYASIQNWIGSFQVYLGTSAGDTSGTLCGDATYRNAGDDTAPYVLSCGGASSGTWITVRQTACPSTCLLALAELEVYQMLGAPSPPPPLLPALWLVRT